MTHRAPLPFAKWHGLGNDFIVLDPRAHGVRCTPALARAAGDRHFGVGFDQLVEILPGEAGEDGVTPDAALVFWNSDGSISGACGNATRCVAAKLLEETGKDALTLRTAFGLLRARVEDGQVAVNMGAPAFDWQDVPLSEPADTASLPLPGAPGAASMGNPHCVFWVEDAEALDPAAEGPQWETHPLFPQKTNVEFIEVKAPDRIRMRVWERGTGVTLACGSGACAAVAAGARRGLHDRRVTVDLDGGSLLIDWREDGIWMAGPTAHVFDAVFTPAFLEKAEAGTARP
ncbi:diaminopimelate epimerase [Rhodovulum sp. DZ06]|uniref:diaminopimelate epimerase n=1 Tax=Rhodovulum sp. DZ06 TaxID=3425126 RepID=UPI003D35567E